MNLGDVIRQVRDLAGDETGVLLTKTRIVDWINNGELDIARELEYFDLVTDTFNTVVGTAGYDLPASFVSMQGVTYNGYTLDKLSIQELDRMDPDRGVTNTRSTPFYYFIGSNKLNLYPIPDTVGAVQRTYISVPGPGWPIASAAIDATVLDLPSWTHDVLVTFSLESAYRFLGKIQQANNEKMDYSRKLGKALAIVQGRSDNQFVGVTDIEDRW